MISSTTSTKYSQTPTKTYKDIKQTKNAQRKQFVKLERYLIK